MMPTRFDITFEVTRADWIEVNEKVMRESPHWIAFAADQRRTMQGNVLLFAPFVIVGAGWMIGTSKSTAGMYVLGGAVGACFSAFLYFTLPRIDRVEQAKKAELERIRQMDYSGFIGTVTIGVDEFGLRVQSASRELKLTWLAVTPVLVGGSVLFQHSQSDGTIVPARVFASESAAGEFFGHVQRWWKDGQLPHAERLERYLAERDVACPKCAYNLRSLLGEKCPECGSELKVEELAGG